MEKDYFEFGMELIEKEAQSLPSLRVLAQSLVGHIADIQDPHARRERAVRAVDIIIGRTIKFYGEEEAEKWLKIFRVKP